MENVSDCLRIPLMEFLDTFFGVGDVTFRFPGILVMIISFPLDQVLDPSTPFPGCQDLLYLEFGMFVNKYGTGRRRRSLNSVCGFFERCKENDIEDGVNSIP